MVDSLEGLEEVTVVKESAKDELVMVGVMMMHADQQLECLLLLTV